MRSERGGLRAVLPEGERQDRAGPIQNAPTSGGSADPSKSPSVLRQQAVDQQAGKFCRTG